MKRAALLKQLRQIAKQRDVDIEQYEGGKHTKIVINGQPIAVPRHSEIAEGTAQSIIRTAEEATK